MHLPKNGKTEELKKDIKLLVEKNEIVSTPTIINQPDYTWLNNKTKYSGTPISDNPYIDKFTCTTNSDIITVGKIEGRTNPDITLH